MLTWSEPTGLAAHYDWMQGFYLARQAYRLADWIGGDRAYLMLLSSSLADFYAYLMAYRTGNPDGIPESWCVWDTGEDNCSRFLRYGAKDGYWAGEKPPVGVGRLPYRSMEYTAYACELAQVIGEIHARLGEADAAHRGTHHRLERKNGIMRAFLDGKAIYTGDCGQCVEISMQGEVLSVKPIP